LKEETNLGRFLPSLQRLVKKYAPAPVAAGRKRIGRRLPEHGRVSSAIAAQSRALPCSSLRLIDLIIFHGAFTRGAVYSWADEKAFIFSPCLFPAK
jgi:hypothetical protein